MLGLPGTTCSSSSTSSTGPPPSAANTPSKRSEKFHRLLSAPSVNLSALRDLLWSGAPDDEPAIRAEAWQLLLGYMPPVRDRQAPGLSKKRDEYEELKWRHYCGAAEDVDDSEGRTTAEA